MPDLNCTATLHSLLLLLTRLKLRMLHVLVAFCALVPPLVLFFLLRIQLGLLSSNRLKCGLDDVSLRD